MEKTIQFTVNGKPQTVTTDPQRPLLDVLREDLHLTGTKYGCGEGDCRSCTVLMDGKSVASCTTSIGDAENQAVQTIEGLAADGKLHPVQEAFLAENAFQCGFCTPGMVMGMVGLLNEIPKPSDGEILSRMNRHLCRCCSYGNYLKALRRAAAESQRAGL